MVKYVTQNSFQEQFLIHGLLVYPDWKTKSHKSLKSDLTNQSGKTVKHGLIELSGIYSVSLDMVSDQW